MPAELGASQRNSIKHLQPVAYLPNITSTLLATARCQGRGCESQVPNSNSPIRPARSTLVRLGWMCSNAVYLPCCALQHKEQSADAWDAAGDSSYDQEGRKMTEQSTRLVLSAAVCDTLCFMRKPVLECSSRKLAADMRIEALVTGVAELQWSQSELVMVC